MIHYLFNPNNLPEHFGIQELPYNNRVSQAATDLILFKVLKQLLMLESFLHQGRKLMTHLFIFYNLLKAFLGRMMGIKFRFAKGTFLTGYK